MFRQGNVLKTILASKTLMAKAVLPEEIPADAGIFDLPRFLSTLSLFKEPDITFEEKNFLIKDSRTKLTYWYASENTLLLPPEKELPEQKSASKILVKWEDLQKIKKACMMMQLPEIQFSVKNDHVYLSAVDSKKSKSSESDAFDICLDTAGGVEPYKVNISVENLKFVASDYEVSITPNVLAHFRSPKVEYWVSVKK